MSDRVILVLKSYHALSILEAVYARRAVFVVQHISNKVLSLFLNH